MMSLAEQYERLYARRRRAHRRRRWIVAFGLALISHALLALGWLLSESLPSPKAPAPPRPIAMRPLSPERWEQNRQMRSPAERPPPAERAPKPETKPSGQVVDVSPGNRQESEDAKYLAESANRVDKETRAKEQTPFYRNAMPKSTSSSPSTSPSPEVGPSTGNQGLGEDARNPAKQTERKKAIADVPDVKRRDQLALRMNPKKPGKGLALKNQPESAEVSGNARRLKIQPGGEEGDEGASPGRKGPLGPPNLLPSPSVLDKIAGGAPNDHLGDVEEGEGTFLNTKEWKYAGFFNRVKQSVGRHWDPSVPLRTRDPTGNIYGGKDRYTVLGVTLNAQGLIQDIQVQKSCGLDFLDEVAIQSFRKAEPFPNPPPGLLRNDALQFSFGFFLEMGGGPRMRLFRQGG
jgi:TonB family protein